MFKSIFTGLKAGANRAKAMTVIEADFGIPSNTQDCLDFLEECSMGFGKNYNEVEMATAYLESLITRMSQIEAKSDPRAIQEVERIHGKCLEFLGAGLIQNKSHVYAIDELYREHFKRTDY